MHLQDPPQEQLNRLVLKYCSGDFENAEIEARHLVAEYPTHPFGWKALGSILQKAGKIQESVLAKQRAVLLNPYDIEAHCNLGNAFQELDHLTEAEKCYRKAIFLNQSFAEPYSNLGNVLNALERYNEAERYCTFAIRLNPNFAEAHCNLGNALMGLKRLEMAAKCYQTAINQKANFAEPHNNMGVIYRDLGQLSKAESCFRTAIGLKPDFTDAHINLGHTLRDLGNLIEAEVAYKNALNIKPSLAEAHNNLGNILRTLGRIDEAEACYRDAILCKPDLAEAYNNLGNVLIDLGRLEEAHLIYLQAIHLQPGLAEAHCNLGISLHSLGHLRDAEESYRTAIRYKPDLAEAHANLSFSLLLQSKFHEGLECYEWRWDGTKELIGKKRKFPQPLWLGDSNICGKKILIHSEQGLGDTIHFCRYIKLLSNLGAKVIFEVQPALAPLIGKMNGVAKLITSGSSLPEFDYHCPLLSLPLAFKTDVQTIPAEIPYLFADNGRVDRWSKKIGVHGFKIGICWKGSRAERSLPLEYFYPLSQLPNVRLISLQKSGGEEDLERLPANMRIQILGDEFDRESAFIDTAAVMQCCDLVISNDTSVAHLAGAIGVSTWVGLSYIPDWRWMLERDDSPWYPTVRLYRQKEIGDWKSVFDRILSDLKVKLGVTHE